MRKNFKKKRTSKNEEKILLIVENSEKEFFRKYFNNYLEKNYHVQVVVESSGTGGNCKITNFSKMIKLIETHLKFNNYKAVFLMIDLDTKCSQTEQNHTCLVELKKEYASKYKIDKLFKDRFYLFVVCNEIESWFLTIDKDKKHTNSPYEDHKKEMEKMFKVKNPPQIVQRMISELEQGKVELDISKNDSLQYFIKKLQEFNDDV